MPCMMGGGVAHFPRLSLRTDNFSSSHTGQTDLLQSHAPGGRQTDVYCTHFWMPSTVSFVLLPAAHPIIPSLERRRQSGEIPGRQAGWQAGYNKQPAKPAGYVPVQARAQGTLTTSYYCHKRWPGCKLLKPLAHPVHSSFLFPLLLLYLVRPLREIICFTLASQHQSSRRVQTARVSPTHTPHSYFICTAEVRWRHTSHSATARGPLDHHAAALLLLLLLFAYGLIKLPTRMESVESDVSINIQSSMMPCAPHTHTHNNNMSPGPACLPACRYLPPLLVSAWYSSTAWYFSDD